MSEALDQEVTVCEGLEALDDDVVADLIKHVRVLFV
jgi:hypothetical protein